MLRGVRCIRAPNTSERQQSLYITAIQARVEGLASSPTSARGEIDIRVRHALAICWTAVVGQTALTQFRLMSAG
jgi:hypothetical protein